MTEEKKICGTSDKLNTTVAQRMDYLLPETSKALQFEKKPKLIQESSWTKTIPYKHWHNYVKPTDSIGSIFTPSVYHHRARILTKSKIKPAQWYPLSADKILTTPPRILIERHNKEVQRRVAAAVEKKRDSLPENIVNLKDLADGTWLQKKSQARVLKRKKLPIHKGRIMKRKLDREVRNIFFVNLTNKCSKKVYESL